MDKITEKSIKKLVDRFYSKVREDVDLGPVFERTIGTNDQAWSKHLHIMYDFWSSIMLGSGRYHGNPHQKHRILPTFDMALFDRWLDLFAQTAHEVHEVEIAQKYVERSQRIAESLKLSVSVGR
ncbi:MAG TPA: group III truncated hemoglobin [Oligoflexia bacterium]|nr:group III truncated hemoglobin [Oligoflexia bacterium]HMR25827.1 group III truncated hemoglobin [Oligoflexia bacterium]